MIGYSGANPVASLMSPSQRAWSVTGSTDRPMTLVLRLANSGCSFARYPSSVVHTGVKSFGCENSTAHESPSQSWNLILPWVVSASKSGAFSPILNAMTGLPRDLDWGKAYRVGGSESRRRRSMLAG